ncbi:MAG: hypothetical protein WCX74_00730 [Candidatus Paceibacterota bacterium]
MSSKKLIFFIFFLSVFCPSFFANAGTILNSYKYAWSNNIGYINFENVVVSDSALTGYAWSKNFGWIKFDATNGGVFNNNGDLTGYAWGDKLGWINFNNVSINTTTGKFSGTATGEIIGTLTFDCPNYCDVRTDWRPASNNQQNGGNGGSSGSVSIPPSSSPPTSPENPTNPFNPASQNPNTSPEKQSSENDPSFNNQSNNDTESRNTNQNTTNALRNGQNEASQNAQDKISEFYQSIEKEEPITRQENDHVESYNAPLDITPTQTGLLVWDFSTVEMLNEEKRQAVVVELPSNIASSEITLSVKQVEEGDIASKGNIKLLGKIFNITASDNTGKTIHEFLDNLKITLIVPENLRGRSDLGVYYLAESSNEWTLVPDAVFDDTSATFYVNHLTHFAILAINDKVISENKELPKTIPAVSATNSAVSFFWIIVLTFFVVMFVFFIARKKENNIK